MKPSIVTLSQVLQSVLPLTLLTTLITLSGCSTVKVIPADQLEVRIKSGESYTPQMDGWFLSDARYQRYRRLIADRILEEERSRNNLAR